MFFDVFIFHPSAPGSFINVFYAHAQTQIAPAIPDLGGGAVDRRSQLFREMPLLEITYGRKKVAGLIDVGK